MPNKKLTLGTILLISMFAFTTLLASSAASAQTQTILHDFNGAGGVDGYNSVSTMIMDKSGNLYGTTTYGGVYSGVVDCCGTVFELSPDGSGGFTYKILYSFKPDNKDGHYPTPTVILADGGNLFGTTTEGGTLYHGTVFELSPQRGGTWKETVLYNFTGSSDGMKPMAGLTVDPKGNLYGTTFLSATVCGCGTVFELTPESGGGFSFKTIYTFNGYPTDGGGPIMPFTFRNGKFFGVTAFGGSYGAYNGTVFELIPNGSGGWTDSILHSFGSSSDDLNPSGAPVVFDSAGNLYGTTGYGGTEGVGAAYELSPSSSGSWTQTIFYSFGTVGAYPSYSPLVFGPKGNIYGAGVSGGVDNAQGDVFELTLSDGTWTGSDLLSFDKTNGLSPYGGVVLGNDGNLYGTTEYGGTNDAGVVYQIKP